MDERDYVAVHSDLPKAGFPGIDHNIVVRNPTEPHDIGGYLSHHEVALPINTALSEA